MAADQNKNVLKYHSDQTNDTYQTEGIITQIPPPESVNMSLWCLANLLPRLCLVFPVVF